jgi:hypothetical protein
MAAFVVSSLAFKSRYYTAQSVNDAQSYEIPKSGLIICRNTVFFTQPAHNNCVSDVVNISLKT